MFGFGGVAERSIAADCKSVPREIRRTRFESRHLHQNFVMNVKKIKDLTPGHIIDYLRAGGWKYGRSDYVSVFELVKEQVSVFVPVCINEEDYKERVERLLSTVSAVEGKEPDAVLSGMVSMPN